MNDDTTIPLQDVLDALVGEVDEPTGANLEEWVARYPAYAAEITDFTLAWAATEHLPERPEPAPEEFLRRGREVVHALPQYPRAAPEPIVSLAAEARRRAVPLNTVAEAAGLSVDLLARLDRRLVRHTTIPPRIVDRLAAVLRRDAASIAAYLQQGPAFAAAHYHAQQAPRLPQQIDFAEAVGSDETLDDGQRAALLALVGEK